MRESKDAAHAAVLNARKRGHLPKHTEKTGRFLHNLRSHGRLSAPEQVLVDALTRHGQSFFQDENGRWWLECTCAKVHWTDADYAAGLNTREEGDLPTKKDKDPVMRNGVSIDVPTGQFLADMRKRGRIAALEQVLVDALTRHHEPLYRDDKGKWRLEPTGEKLNWTDADYAAGLNTRGKGDLPRHQREKDRVVRNGVSVAVPTGKFLYDLSYRGRIHAPEKVLVDALARHSLKMERDGEGLWRLVDQQGRSFTGHGHGNAVGQGHWQDVSHAGSSGADAGPSSLYAGQGAADQSTQAELPWSPEPIFGDVDTDALMRTVDTHAMLNAAFETYPDASLHPAVEGPSSFPPPVNPIEPYIHGNSYPAGGWDAGHSGVGGLSQGMDGLTITASAYPPAGYPDVAYTQWRNPAYGPVGYSQGAPYAQGSNPAYSPVEYSQGAPYTQGSNAAQVAAPGTKGRSRRT
ncbi:hypothetical protein [Streptomyces sp. NPDC006012]|uniref:hypothetical protein n=1 Tax=Streptomyces sp. NPDC006012 TaxID=3364739 RepID=UPI003679F41F